MNYEEKYNIEFKEDVTRTFLKTVSAFANYTNGEIIFGINDVSKEIIGIDQPNEIKLKIENMINDSIVPSPRYSIENEIRENKTLLILKVNKGENTPYLYKNKAYIRNDTSTVEVDRNQLMDLLLKGKNIDYEDLESQNQNLTFNYLEQSLKKILEFQTLTMTFY